MAEAKLNVYEAMFLLGAAAVGDQEAAVNQCRQVIERHEGQIIVCKKWDERKLMYEIEGNKRGLYVICYYRAPGKSVTPIEREVNLSESFLRVLITRADHLTEAEMNAVEPQPIQPREERIGGYEERGGDRGDRDRGGDRGGRRPRRDDGGESDKD